MVTFACHSDELRRSEEESRFDLIKLTPLFPGLFPPGP